MKLQKDFMRVLFEEVQNFSLSLGFLYKFFEFYLNVRIADVIIKRKV